MNTPIASPEAAGTVQNVTSFLRLVEDLLREPTERAAYLADPVGYLPARGFGDFDTADVEMSLQLSADALPPALAERLDPSAGLDTIVSVDIDELPGLWAQDDAGVMSLDEMAHEDDPFLDEHAPAPPDHEGADVERGDADAADPDDLAVEVEEVAEADVPDVFSPGLSDAVESLGDPATAFDGAGLAVDDGFEEPIGSDESVAAADEIGLETLPDFDDDVPFD